MNTELQRLMKGGNDESENAMPGCGGATNRDDESRRLAHSDTTPGLAGSDDAMSSLHWFPWYPNRWIGSLSVKCMDITERGAFRELLDWQWQGQGYLPADESTLSKVVGFDVTAFGKVLAKFPVQSNGMRANSVLLEIWHEQSRKHQHRVDCADKRWHGKKVAKKENTEIDTDTDTDTEAPAHALHDAKHDAKHTKPETDSDFIGELKKLYTWVDVDKEFSKMQAWLLTPQGRGRKITRRFAVNWLNKVDKPLAVSPAISAPVESVFTLEKRIAAAKAEIDAMPKYPTDQTPEQRKRIEELRSRIAGWKKRIGGG